MRKVFYSLPLDSQGDDLHVCHCSPDAGEAPCLVLFSHGFGSNGTGDHRMFMDIADAFVTAGMSCVLFDYRGCGYSGGRFDDLTPSREVQDLLAVYCFVDEKLVEPEARIGVLSQSHGSYIALLAIPKMDRVAAACLWGAPANPYERYVRHFNKLERASQSFILENGHTISRNFLEDVKKQDAESSARAIRCPVLVLHAGKDEMVPLAEGKHVYELLTCVKDFAVIEGANHSYRMQYDLQKKAADVSLGWFSKHLLQSSATRKS